MRYDEFCSQLQNALRNEGLFRQFIGSPAETIELASGARHWEVFVMQSSSLHAETFHVSAKIAFEWSPFNTARSYTTEEDLLTELLGRKKQSLATAQRFVRVDLDLQASLPYGATTTLPDSQVFGGWTTSVNQKLDGLLTEHKERQGRLIAILGGLNEVEVHARGDAGDLLCIQRISVAGFRLVRVPRAWDNPDRRSAEKGAAGELARLAQRFKDAIDEWAGSVAELERWIRYTPPPPEAKQAEPWFVDEEEENEDGGPQMIH
jgi:hypothetical protein